MATYQVFGDLDGDFKTDRAFLHSNGALKTIEIKFADLRIRRFSFVTTCYEQGRLVTRDIDGDSDLDLIWLAEGESNSAAVFINEGSGNFSKAESNAPYTAALNALLNSTDPSDAPSLNARDADSTLSSPASIDFSATAGNLLASGKARLDPAYRSDQPTHESLFLGDIHKRGPPVELS